MKKKVIFLVLTLVFCIGCFNLGKLFKSDVLEDKVNESDSVKHLSSLNTLSMMLETEAGSGEYTLENRSSWPTKDDGYVFNEELSKCENGGSLSFNEETSSVVMKGSISDKCYAYFDIYSPTFENTCTSGENLSSCIIAMYGKDASLYYHNGTIVSDNNILDANDNSYRYSGANPNNFVCFGTNEESCPDDNLYRIIGVFNNQVKLIKWDYATSTTLGTNGDYNNQNNSQSTDTSNYKGTLETINYYFWNSTSSDTNDYNNEWFNSKLNSINLNNKFLEKIKTEWSNKISSVSWIVGGNSYENIRDVVPSNSYQNELVNYDKTQIRQYEIDAKVGLMYVSDYAYATSPDLWSTTLYNYFSEDIKNNNWMYMGIEEWTITRSTSYSNIAFCILSAGGVHGKAVNNNALGVRPVFYLTSDSIYIKGDGTKLNPIYLN